MKTASKDVIEALEDLEIGTRRIVTRQGPIDIGSEEELAETQPIRKLLNMVMLLAIKDQASDIHFEPFEDEFKIRVRADGVLYEMVPPPRHLANAIVTRIKVMAELDIAERRLPQDGRIELNVGGNAVDLRISVLPTMFGESVVMRILDRTVVQLDLNKIGMDPQTLLAFPRDHPAAQRHCTGDGAHRERQDHHALLGPQRTQRHRDQDHHHARIRSSTTSTG